MSHKHSLYDTDPHFKIDPDTRLISDLSNKGTTIVQNDHNSERFTFELPRIIDGHDMSLCNVVEVHYLNIGSTERHSDVYEVDDLSVSPDSSDVVICSWLLSQNATALSGALNFVLRFMCTSTDEDGLSVVDYAWSTGVYTKIVITPGIFNSDIVVEQYADVLEEWRQQLFGSPADKIDTYTKAEIDQILSNFKVSKSLLLTDDFELEDSPDHVFVTKEGDSAFVNNDGVSTSTLDTMNEFGSPFPVLFHLDITGYVKFTCHSTGYAEVLIDGNNVVNSSGEERTFEGNVTNLLTVRVEYGSMVFTEFKTLDIVNIEEELSKINERLSKTPETDSSPSQCANAFVKMVSGEAIRVDDISPIKHKAKVNVRGKNLVDVANMVSTVSSNNFVSNGDGTYTLTKTTEGNSIKRFSAGDIFQSPILANTVFRISCTIVEDTSSGGLYIALYDSAGQAIAYPSAAAIDIKSFSYDIDIHSIRLYLLGNEPDGSYVTIKDLQIELGDTATEYEPYIDPSSVNVSVFRKNIFPALPETSKDGITLTKVNDYYVLNGTATSSGLITTTKSLPTGTYTLSANNPTHNSLDLAIVQIYSDTTKKSMVAKDNTSYSTHTMDIPASNDYQFRIRYENGITYNDYIIKPQLELGSNATDYERYKEPVLYSPAYDGTLEIDSISPIMTVLTDTDNAIVDLTYHRDANKVIGDVESALDAILAIQSEVVGDAS